MVSLFLHWYRQYRSVLVIFMLTFKDYIKIALLTLCIMGPSAMTAHARALTVDLSAPVVQITAGFSGTELLLFGVAPSSGNVIVVVRGPQETIKVRKKSNIAGIWVNKDQMTFENVPAFYAMASNRPITEFLPDSIADIQQIGLDFIDLTAENGSRSLNPETNTSFQQALLRNKINQGLYQDQLNSLIFLGNRLFRTKLKFPANVAVGTYGIDVHLIYKGELVSSETTLLSVRKFGMEASIFDFAHRHAEVYGIISILMACFAGWAANSVFRRS